MNSNTLEVNGGRNIKPSARKSIHSNCNTCNNQCHKTMGVYGLNGNRKREEKPGNVTQEQGVDEVDNVMSKMARQSSPVTLRRNNHLNFRRKSVGLDSDTDDSSNELSHNDNENILSKSSPASFSYSRKDLSISASQDEIQRSWNESNYSINNSSLNRRHNNSSSTNIQQKYRETEKSSYQFVIAIIILIIAVIICFYKNCSIHDSGPLLTNNVYDKLRFDNDVKHLTEKYKVRDHSILQVKTGVATIFENQDTASFIFLYNSESGNFNPIRFNNFIEDFAAITSRYLRNENKQAHVTVDRSNLVMGTTKEFMNQYQDEVTKTGVMLVKDIDSVPSQLAMAFHYYCDEFNPLVKRSAIFFTLNSANCFLISDKLSRHKYIEMCLANKWNTVGEEKIQPLLARVVNIVVDVTQTF